MGVRPIGGASVLMGEVFKKNCSIGGCTPHDPPPTMGNPDISELMLWLHKGKFMNIKYQV